MSFNEGMYAVVSKWEAESGHVDEVRARGEEMMGQIRSWDGVEGAFNIQTSPNTILAVITYRDQPTSERLVQDPEGPFAKAAAATGIENHATWLWSERGEVG